MPSALSVPICEPTSRNGACSIRTSVERNVKQTIIAAASVIAIFTIVHRKSSKCSRNGLEVSLSGTSRNLKMSRSVLRSESEIRISKSDAYALQELTRNGNDMLDLFRAKRFGNARRLRIAFGRLRAHAREKITG